MGRRIRKNYRRRYRFRRSNRKYLKRMVKKVIYNEAETRFKTFGLNNVRVGSDITNELRWIDQLTEKDGRQIAVKNISFNIHASTNISAPGNGPFRIMVLWPRKSVTTSDLTQYLTSGIPGMYGRMDPNLALVLYDKTALIVPAAANTGSITRNFKFSHYCKMWRTQIEDTSGQSTTQPIVYMTSTLGTPNGVFINGYMTISYKDL